MKTKSIFFAILATMALNVNAAIIYSSTFTDNGNKVTEVRTFADSSVQTWEWLDLTITNGISYNSLIVDLADDGKLNNNSGALDANAGAITDVAGLSPDDQSGWETQTDEDIVNLINNFFGLSLVDKESHNYNENVSLVDQFIDFFGDTSYEGILDTGVNPIIVNPLGVSQYTAGMTNTPHISIQDVVSRPTVFDGQWASALTDGSVDWIDLGINADAVIGNPGTGTWLVREAIPVNAPSTIVLFALALMGIGVRRRLM